MDKIDVGQFVEQYKAEKTEAGRKKLVKSCIAREYVPVLEKYVTLFSCFEHSLKRENGIIRFNSFMEYVEYIMLTVKMYTNLDLENDTANKYDLLKSCGALDEILLMIGKEELEELQRIHTMIVADAHDNEKNMQTYISYIVEQVVNNFSDFLNKPEVTEYIKKITQKE